MLGDLEAVGEDVDQQEYEDPDREHRQGDTGARTEQLQSRHGQPEEDRETGERAEEEPSPKKSSICLARTKLIRSP